uniref:Methyltransferase n=1 Tax=Ascaris suum TaxID=6253 RepID=F1L9I4_ASCSU
MQLVLTFLPNIAARIGNVESLLDFGAGPTIHVAVAFRNTANNIYLADYLPQNREELLRWLNHTARFDWSTTIKKIATIEGLAWSNVQQMETDAHSKVRGVFHCDCFKRPSVNAPPSLLNKFDVVTTIFCIEYCCNTIDEYKSAVANVAEQVKPGGFLMMGAILKETWCSFGGRKFTCLYIDEELVVSTLRECGFLIDDPHSTCLFNHESILVLCSRKKVE